MSESNRREFLARLGLALPGLYIAGCRTESATPVAYSPVAEPTAAPPVAVHRSSSRKYVESKRDRDLGEQAWNAVQKRPELASENTEVGNTYRASKFEEWRHGTLDYLLRLDVSLMAAQVGGSSSWSGGLGRDYVAGSMADALNKAVDGYQDRTNLGLVYTLPQVNGNSRAGAGVDALQAAVTRTLAMLNGGAPQDRRVDDAGNRIDDITANQTQKSYVRTCAEINRLKFDTRDVFNNAGWSAYNVPISDDNRVLKTLQFEYGDTPADVKRDVPGHHPLRRLFGLGPAS